MPESTRADRLEVWRLSVCSGLQGVNFDLREPGGFLTRYSRPFFGEAMRGKWRVWRTYGTNPSRLNANFFSFLNGIGMRRSAVEKLGHLVEPWGELLPIEIEAEGVCHVFNCTYVSRDAVNVSRLRQIPREQQEQTHYDFQASVVRNLAIFKIPQSRSWTLLVRGPHVPPQKDFYSVYHDAKLTGLRFDKIWAQEGPRSRSAQCCPAQSVLEH